MVGSCPYSFVPPPVSWLRIAHAKGSGRAAARAADRVRTGIFMPIRRIRIHRIGSDGLMDMPVLLRMTLTNLVRRPDRWHNTRPPAVVAAFLAEPDMEVQAPACEGDDAGD